MKNHFKIHSNSSLELMESEDNDKSSDNSDCELNEFQIDNPILTHNEHNNLKLLIDINPQKLRVHAVQMHLHVVLKQNLFLKQINQQFQKITNKIL